MSESIRDKLTLTRQINLLESKRTGWILNLLSVPIAIAFYYVFNKFFQILEDVFELRTEESIVSFILLGVSFFAIILVHEAIHGLFFKLFNPDGKVKYGFTNGMAYATSPNSLYTKYQFSVIVLAPFVIITTLILLVALSGVVPYSHFIILASFHAGACVGDFYYIYLLIQSPKQTWVEDTEVGINLYLKDRS